jgi:hypothetical protein
LLGLQDRASCDKASAGRALVDLLAMNVTQHMLEEQGEELDAAEHMLAEQGEELDAVKHMLADRAGRGAGRSEAEAGRAA